MDETRARDLLGQEVDRVGRIMAEVKDGLGEGSEAEELGELSDNDQHPADTGTETFEREKDIAILESLEHELHELEEALRRVDEGSYGTCEACGADLAPERLEAQPAARFCVEHAPQR